MKYADRRLIFRRLSALLGRLQFLIAFCWPEGQNMLHGVHTCAFGGLA